jgi:hypothetical protein
MCHIKGKEKRFNPTSRYDPLFAHRLSRFLALQKENEFPLCVDSETFLASNSHSAKSQEQDTLSNFRSDSGFKVSKRGA